MIFTLLEDLVEAATIDECRDVFTFIEERVAILRKPHLFDGKFGGKLVMLRCCNQLLRRLSKVHGICSWAGVYWIQPAKAREVKAARRGEGRGGVELLSLRQPLMIVGGAALDWASPATKGVIEAVARDQERGVAGAYLPVHVRDAR